MLILHEMGVWHEQFKLRKASEDDVEELKILFQETVLTVNSRDYSLSEVEDWASCGNNLLKWKDAINTHYFILAVNQQLRIVGFSSITTQGYLHFLFVHKDYQNKGIATVLLDEMERCARTSGMRRVTSEVSLTARSFFEKRGYIAVQKQCRKANLLYLTNFLMVKELK